MSLHESLMVRFCGEFLRLPEAAHELQGESCHGKRHEADGLHARVNGGSTCG